MATAQSLRAAVPVDRAASSSSNSNNNDGNRRGKLLIRFEFGGNR